MKIEEGELELVAYFNNGRYATCMRGALRISVPKGAEILEYVEIQPPIYFEATGELSDSEIERTKEVRSYTELGGIGRDKVAAVIEGRGVPEFKNVKSVCKEVYIVGTKRRVDLVVETEDGSFIVIEVEAARNPDIDYIKNRFRQGMDQIKEYMELIKEHGIDPSKMGKEEPIKDVDSY